MMTDKRLVRSQSDKMIGGVCGGLGEYFGIDPTLIRIAFALLVVFGAGSPLLLYLLLWIVIPSANSPRALIEAGAENPATTSVTETMTETEVAAPKPVTPAAPVQVSDPAEGEPTAGELVAVA